MILRRGSRMHPYPAQMLRAVLAHGMNPCYNAVIPGKEAGK